MNLKSIHDIFTNRIFRIPSYQRGYSWGNSREASSDHSNIQGQLMDLWNDIINIPDGSWHYTGLLTLVASQKPDKLKWLRNHEQFDIVDGQQRITSILILISVMVEKARQLGSESSLCPDDNTTFRYLRREEKGAKADIFGYNHDNPSDKFFRKHILDLHNVEDDSKESAYTENLKKAKSFFEGMVSQYISTPPSDKISDQTASLKELFKRVTTGLRLNEHILPEELDAYVVFETMNNRGKPLSELEKLKNRLMYLADKFSLDSQDEVLHQAIKNTLFDEINHCWITIYQSLGANKSSALGDEAFLKNHWIAYFNNYSRSEANVYANHLFNEYFTIERVYSKELKPADITNYIESLQRSSVEWNKMHNPQFFTSEEQASKDGITALHRVGFRASYKPVVLAALQCQQSDKKILQHLFSLLEQHAFKIFYVTGRKSNTGDSKLYRLAYQVLSGEASIEVACEHIQCHIEDYYRFKSFEGWISELFDSGNKQGFYAWSGLRYFLYKYDLELRTVSKTSTAASELVWEDFNRKDTIEHIYPQSAAQSIEAYCGADTSKARKDSFNKIQSSWQAFAKYPAEQRKRLCNSLGNLLPISHSDNASFNNDPFVFKVDQTNKGEGYINRGYIHDSMSAQIVAKLDDWTPQKVLERGLSMIDALLSLLNESSALLSDEDKVRLLGLDFMLPVPTNEPVSA